jgi:multidrug efflux pump subunit AcrA (membrane-fusion protein)
MRKLVVSLAVLVVVAGGVTTWLLTRGAHATAAKASTATVARGDLSVTASASGTVVAINQRALNFGTSGTVATLKVKAGDHVTTGQVLATLDDSDAQDAVSAAQSALDAAKDNLTLAKSQAAAAKATPTATASSSSGSGGPGGSQGGQGGAQGGQSGGGSAGSRTTTTSTGTDNVLRAQQAVNNDELALEQAQGKLDGTSIVAPSSGRVLSVAGAVGDSVSAGGSGFVVISGTGDLAVTAEFSEADVAAVKVGQQATVTLANHPDKKYAATVTQIDPAGVTSGSLVRYGVELTFSSVPTGLLLGQSADVAVTTALATGVLYVPAAAVSKDAAGQGTVLVRTADGDLSYTVTTGLQGDQGVEIKSGLTAGLTVVVR